MNTAINLYRELFTLGVTIWQESGRLRYRAPAQALTAKHLAVMKANKAQLLALLTATRTNDQALAVPRCDAAICAVGPAIFILTYEVDGKQATCRDPVSSTLLEALADLQAMYGCRLGRVWQLGSLAYEPREIR